jgi:hypothetical protein
VRKGCFCTSTKRFRRARVEGVSLAFGIGLDGAPLLVEEASRDVQLTLSQDEKDDDDGDRDSSESVHLLDTTFFIYKRQDDYSRARYTSS